MKHILFTGGAVFLVALLRSLILTGLSNDTVYLFLFTAACFIYGAFYKTLVKIRWLNGLLLACAGFFLGLAIFLAVYGLNDNSTFEEDAVIVLGCGLKGDKPSLMLQLRLNKAAEYHRQNPSALIVVSGGQGGNEAVPEAVAMERYLVAQGVDAGKIVREEKSLSTYENLMYSVPLLKEYLGDNFSAAVITSDYHIYRGVRFAEAAGADVTHLHAGSAWYLTPINYARECAAVIKMWVIRR